MTADVHANLIRGKADITGRKVKRRRRIDFHADNRRNFTSDIGKHIPVEPAAAEERDCTVVVNSDRVRGQVDIDADIRVANRRTAFIEEWHPVEVGELIGEIRYHGFPRFGNDQPVIRNGFDLQLDRTALESRHVGFELPDQTIGRSEDELIDTRIQISREGSVANDRVVIGRGECELPRSDEGPLPLGKLGAIPAAKHGQSVDVTISSQGGELIARRLGIGQIAATQVRYGLFADKVAFDFEPLEKVIEKHNLRGAKLPRNERVALGRVEDDLVRLAQIDLDQHLASCVAGRQAKKIAVAATEKIACCARCLIVLAQFLVSVVRRVAALTSKGPHEAKGVMLVADPRVNNKCDKSGPTLQVYRKNPKNTSKLGPFERNF